MVNAKLNGGHKATMGLQSKFTRNDEITMILIELEQNSGGVLKFLSLIRRLRMKMLNQKRQVEDVTRILASMVEVFLFRRFILKPHTTNQYFSTTKMPLDLVEFLNSKYCNGTAKNGVIVKSISINAGSKLDEWIKSEFLKQVKGLFRGVVGYHAHIRFASSFKDQKKQEWDERYKTTHSNFHWDEQLNSFSTITYLTDVSKGDAEFKIIKDVNNFCPNLYIAAYDHYFTTIQNKVSSNRVGDYMLSFPENKITPILGKKGTTVSFYGRQLLHDGGFPKLGHSRIALFLEQKNLFMRPIQKMSKLIAFTISRF